MQQNVSPKMLISVIALVVVLVGVMIFRVMTAPSSTPAPGVEAGKPVPPSAGGGGPTAEDLQRMREYNAANPGAASSRR